MKLTALLLMLSLAGGEPLSCPERPAWSHETGSWISEKDITKENASASLEHLRKLLSGEVNELSASGWELDVSLKLVEGYIRKLAAKQAAANQDPQHRAIKENYCRWLEKRGFYLGAHLPERLPYNKSLNSTAAAVPPPSDAPYRRAG